MKTTLLASAIRAGICHTSPKPMLRAFAAADGAADLPVIRPVMTLRPSAAAGEYELMIYGDIGESWYGESVTAASVVEQLAALDATTAQINVRINSYGGSVSDGLAIYNVLKRTAAKKVGTVDGVAMSSASLIAMACDELSMPKTSLMMIHAPWGCAMGNANDMRLMADVLDVYSQAMVDAYAKKSGMAGADVLALLTDGQDHYYTGEQAVAAGFANTLIETALPTEPEEAGDASAQQAAPSRPRGFDRFASRMPTQIAAMAIAAARRAPHASAASAVANPADLAISGENDMLARHKGRLVSLSPKARATTIHREGEEGGGGGGGGAPTPEARASAALRERNAGIKAALKPVMAIAGVRELYEQALEDPDMTVDQVNAKALALAGAHASPAAGGGVHVESGADQRDKDQVAMSECLVARASAMAKKNPDGTRAFEPVQVSAGNPFRGHSITDMAEHCLRASGVNTTRMSKSEIASKAMLRPLNAAGLTTSDFPNLLENTLNKILVKAYMGAPVTWPRFCRVTELNDFRAHPRYRIGTFSDLKTVNEAGNYEQGSMSDAERESITAVRKGRLLVITREMIVNDDLQGITDVAAGLGGVAARTVEKDVFALFASNGPTMGDGNPLFHSSHNNIAAVSAVSSMASFDAARVAMASQLDPSGNDYLDVRPAIWLGPLTLGGLARSINRSQYDPDASNKLQKPNIVLNLFDDIVDTPRLSGTAWYTLASPSDEPVFEVGFLGGQREPIVEQERDFTSDGMRWKVVLEYGVNATGWRGIQKNAGA